ncbi:MAG TPA: RidA family protein [Desulfatiglandales bacterium]|nr:RidA family protein [Desulfatiglandales bacterium]
MDSRVKRYPAYCGGVRQTYPHITPGGSFYSRSVVVDNLIFLSAVSPRSTESGETEAKTIEEQVKATLDNLKHAVEEAGGSLNNIVRNTIIVRNLADWARVRKAQLEYYQRNAPLLAQDPPASTFITANLEDPDFLVQIDALGLVTRGEPGWEMKTYPAYYAGVKQGYPHVAPGEPKFARSVVVGNVVFCSGANARSLVSGKVETDDVEEQMTVALDKVRMTMEEAGGSLSNIVKTLIRLKHVSADYSRMRKAETEYYLKHAPALAEDPPASTVCQAHFDKEEYLAGVEAIGLVSRNRPDCKMKKYPAYYGGIKYAYPHVAPGHPMFSRSAVVGNLIFCSGATGLSLGSFKQTSNDINDQMVMTMNKLKTYMEQAGSSMENIVKTIIYIRKMDDYPALRKAELEYYQIHAPALVGEPPASTVIEAPLHQPETLMEIEVFGVMEA